MVQRVVGLMALLAGLLALYAYGEARSDPVVRRASIALADWPLGAAPVRVALLSDIHIGNAAMDADRLSRIVGQVNMLSPDLVLIAGDFIFGHDPDGAARLAPALVAPLARLNAPLGVVAVPGNHDHWTGIGALADALRRAHVTLLANDAAGRGPLAILAIDDDFSGHADIAVTMARAQALSGARVVLTHSPDIAPSLGSGLVLAGHTHCGQVLLPIYGPISDVSQFGARYRCGPVRESGRTVVVTAGLGASGGPFRLNAPPDLWLITLGPR